TLFRSQVISLLNDENIGHAIYDGVEPNPKIANCLDGMKVYNENKCDGIITIGGGSSHDCGKGIGIAATHDGDLTDYAGIETLTKDRKSTRLNSSHVSISYAVF